MSFYHNVNRSAGGTYFLVRALCDMERTYGYQSKAERCRLNRSLHYLHSNTLQHLGPSMLKKFPFYIITTQSHQFFKNKNVSTRFMTASDSNVGSCDLKLTKLYNNFKNSDEKNFTHRMK
jgi:hypothetical protein